MFAPRLQVAGVQMGQAADAAVLMALEPLVASVAAAFFLREYIGPRRWIGFALGLSGAVFMARVWRPDFHLPGLAANGLFIASFVCEAAYSVMGKPLLGRAGLLKIVAVALLAGAAVNLLWDGRATLAAARVLPGHVWGVLIYCRSSARSWVCVWFVVIRRRNECRALTVFIQPVLGLLIAKVTLNEAWHWGQLWGSLAILLGLGIGLSRQITIRRRK